MKQQLEKTIERLLRKGHITCKEAFDFLKILAQYQESTPFITTSQCETTVDNWLHSSNLFDSSDSSVKSVNSIYSL
jgi:hypothetical protein